MKNDIEINNIHGRTRLFTALISSLIPEATENIRVLDLGCGDGSMVHRLRNAGFDAYGCDVSFKPGPFVDSLIKQSALSIIPTSPYQLPFESGFFDVVISDQVLEHVENIDETNSEVARVLNNNGLALHIFPSKYTPIEPHVRVPLATILQGKKWLSIWQFVGIGRRAGSSVHGSLAADNHAYLTTFTHYRGHKDLDRLFLKHFTELHNLEHQFLTCRTIDNKTLNFFLSSKIAAILYRYFFDRIVCLRK